MAGGRLAGGDRRHRDVPRPDRRHHFVAVADRYQSARWRRPAGGNRAAVSSLRAPGAGHASRAAGARRAQLAKGLRSAGTPAAGHSRPPGVRGSTARPGATSRRRRQPPPQVGADCRKRWSASGRRRSSRARRFCCRFMSRVAAGSWFYGCCRARSRPGCWAKFVASGGEPPRAESNSAVWKARCAWRCRGLPSGSSCGGRRCRPTSWALRIERASSGRCWRRYCSASASWCA